MWSNTLLAENDEVVVWGFVGNLLNANHYLVLHKNTAEFFAIDSGFGSGDLLAFIASSGIPLSAIYLTHGHFDHAGGAAVLAQYSGCATYLRATDSRVINKSNFLLRVFGYNETMEIPPLELVEPSFADTRVEFLDCPGHTPGSVLVKVGSFVFTGDSVYADRVNLVKLPEQDDNALVTNLRRLLPSLVSAERIFPGHGRDTTGAKLLKENVQLQVQLEA